MNIRQLARIGAALAATAVTLGVLAACGGSGAKTTAASATSAPSQNGQQSIQAYISCLNKNGVTIALPSRGAGGGFGGGTRPSDRPSGVRPSRSPGAGGGFGGGGFGGGGLGGIFGNPSTPPSGVAQSTWTAALAACKSLQPSFTGGGFGGGARGGTQFQAYRNCLTSHGVSASAAPGGGAGGGFNTSDPTIAAAVKACRPLLPTQAPNPAPSPSS